jgi:hypothetical protein
MTGKEEVIPARSRLIGDQGSLDYVLKARFWTANEWVKSRERIPIGDASKCTR